jgi:acetyltransferase-like isoleucine patch superfamily enzyme
MFIETDLGQTSKEQILWLKKNDIHISPNSVVECCEVGRGTMIWHHCNLYRCTIGTNCEIGSFVEIGEGVTIGDRCKILPYAFIPPGIDIGDRCFIGPHVSFSNDRYPTVVQKEVENTVIEDDVNIGAGTIILPGVHIASGITVGAGSLVTKKLMEKGIYYGHPAKIGRRAGTD